ncbi:MAG: HEAT repeat domain-containing protein [Deltaproteobacteria bacterium]|nr:HEAT repeat domain-containing protein [Deltaproteobacteria bacterium]
MSQPRQRERCPDADNGRRGSGDSAATTSRHHVVVRVVVTVLGVAVASSALAQTPARPGRRGNGGKNRLGSMGGMGDRDWQSFQRRLRHRPGPRRSIRLSHALRNRIEEERRQAIVRRQHRIDAMLHKIGVRARYGRSQRRIVIIRRMADLKSDDPHVRAQAAWWLGSHHAKAAAGALARLLKDSSAVVRANAIYALGQLRVRHLGSALFDLLDRDKSADVRGRAAEALGRIGYRRAIPLLLSLLHAKDTRLRTGAIEGLGWMADVAAVSPLVRLTRAKDAQIRMRAARALGRAGFARSVRPLLHLLDDSDSIVVATAVDTLSRLKAKALVSRLPALLRHAQPRVRIAAEQAAVVFRASALVGKISALVPDRSPLVGCQAALSLARLGAKIPRQGLAGLLGDQDNRVRIMAVEAAGLSDARWTIPIVLGFLKKGYEDLRRVSARALGLLEAGEAEGKLLALLKDPSAPVRAAAVESLGLVGGARALAACEVLTADRDPDVVVAAVTCVARRAAVAPELATRSVRQMLRLLRYKTPCHLSAPAARALTALKVKGNRTAFLRVVRLTLNDDPVCRAAAAWALGFVAVGRGAEAVSALDRLLTRDHDMDVRVRAALALGLLGRRAFLGKMSELFHHQVSKASRARRFLVALAMALVEPSWRPRVARLFQEAVCGPILSVEQVRLVEMLGRLQSATRAKWIEALVERSLSCPVAMVRARARMVLRRAPPAYRPGAAGLLVTHGKAAGATSKKKAQASMAPRRLRRQRPDADLTGPFPMPHGSSGCGCSLLSADRNERVIPWLLLGLLFLGLFLCRADLDIKKRMVGRPCGADERDAREGAPQQDDKHRGWS